MPQQRVSTKISSGPISGMGTSSIRSGLPTSCMTAAFTVNPLITIETRAPLFSRYQIVSVRKDAHGDNQNGKADEERTCRCLGSAFPLLSHEAQNIGHQ